MVQNLDMYKKAIYEVARGDQNQREDVHDNNRRFSLDRDSGKTSAQFFVDGFGFGQALQHVFFFDW